MKYTNGREAKLNDRVVAPSPSGLFIGTVVEFEGVHLRVMPLHSQQNFYVDPAKTLHLDDALVKPAAE